MTDLMFYAGLHLRVAPRCSLLEPLQSAYQITDSGVRPYILHVLQATGSLRHEFIS
jgi:hypothetical protein